MGLPVPDAPVGAPLVSRPPLLGTAARRLLAAIPTVPGPRLLATVSGPARCGKSTLMDELAIAYRARGIRTHRQKAAFAPRASSSRCAILVDDADSLGDDDLTALLAIVDDEAVDLIVAYGSGPHPPALQRLANELDRHRAPTLLGPVSARDVEGYLRSSVGPRDPGAFDRLHAMIGGMPWLVCAIAKTAAAGSVADPASCRPLLDLIAHEIDTLPPAVRDLLLARAVGFDPSTVMPAGGPAQDAANDLAGAEGMLQPDGRTIPLVDRALLATTPGHRIETLQRALVDAIVAGGHPLTTLAPTLVERGMRDPRLAAALILLGDRAIDTQPDRAGIRYAEAIRAGADVGALSARRAQAAFGSGDALSSSRFADEVLASDGDHDLPRAIAVAAADWSARAMMSRAADLYRAAAADAPRSSAPIAAAVLIGVGDRRGADAAWPGSAHEVTPTLVNAAAALLGQGVRASIGDAPGRALPALTRSADMLTASGVIPPWPETPAAVAALVALNTGELEVAASVLDAAIVGDHGGAPARTRLRLLRAWTAMQAGRLDLARDLITDAIATETIKGEASTTEAINADAIAAHATPAGAPADPLRTGSRPGAPATTLTAGLRRRDELLLRALEVGIARRGDDAAALVAAWRRARETVLHVSVDLYSLLPLGELLVAAARLKDTDRVASHAADAWALLDRLGNPPLWAVPLHWSAIQAAILAEQPKEVAPHAAALVRASVHSRVAGVMATAGRAWMSVLAGDVDAAVVESAARAFEPIGLAWEGSRLAGHAAPRAEDRRDMTRLLACARDLHPSGGSETTVDPTVDRPGADAPVTSFRHGLTARERQIARLVLDGRTYWEIGESIFISPRTVEHHVARMRRRLGASSRSELLSRLRDALDG